MDECQCPEICGDDPTNSIFGGKPNFPCENTLGGYNCLCNSTGYTAGFYFNGIRCHQSMTPSIDELVDDCDSCDQNAYCWVVNGQEVCSCKEGYTGNGEYCRNIDECTEGGGCRFNGNYESLDTCTDTEGGYECTCNVTAGYTLSNRCGIGGLCVPAEQKMQDKVIKDI